MAKRLTVNRVRLCKRLFIIWALLKLISVTDIFLLCFRKTLEITVLPPHLRIMNYIKAFLILPSQSHYFGLCLIAPILNGFAKWNLFFPMFSFDPPYNIRKPGWFSYLFWEIFYFDITEKVYLNLYWQLYMICLFWSLIS